MAQSEREQLMRAGPVARRFDSVVDVKSAFTHACAACGEPRKRDATFCAACGHSFEAVRRGARPFFPDRARAEVWRRVAAEAIDRCLPLPLIAWWWPEWTLVVVAYHLLCDATPSGRSVGKALCRLRAISVATLEPCGVVRAVMRRLGVAAAQALYCRWEFVWLALAYDALSLLFLRLAPGGRRLEEYAAGTQVITEGAFRAMRRRCGNCGERVLERSRYCPYCGVGRES